MCFMSACQVSWMKTLGKEGQVVYIFGLKRRPGQEQSLSKPVSSRGWQQWCAALRQYTRCTATTVLCINRLWQAPFAWLLALVS